MTYKENCKGCNITRSQPRGGIIEIGKHWLVNQYWGGEGFLGWLALQPREHHMRLEELSDEEASEMGRAIKDVKMRLNKYWEKEWPHDRLDRLYVTYFFESVFDNNPTEYHLHIHLIPRTRKMRALISKKGTIICWEIYKISKMDGFPEEYFRYEERVEKLMSALRQMIPSS
jgi:diadenosine tetraphosphate (Ap4A) HIT family hydrolase